jgi:hypothetical protein
MSRTYIFSFRSQKRLFSRIVLDSNFELHSHTPDQKGAPHIAYLKTRLAISSGLRPSRRQKPNYNKMETPNRNHGAGESTPADEDGPVEIQDSTTLEERVTFLETAIKANQWESDKISNGVDEIARTFEMKELKKLEEEELRDLKLQRKKKRKKQPMGTSLPQLGLAR